VVVCGQSGFSTDSRGAVQVQIEKREKLEKRKRKAGPLEVRKAKDLVRGN